MQTSTVAEARCYGLRAHLVALVAAAFFPAFTVGVVAVAGAVNSYRATFDERLEANARSLVPAVEAELDARGVALSTLALSPDLDAGGDLGAFHGRARQVADAFGSRVFFATPSPEVKVILHTALAPDEGIPPAVATDERRSAPASAAVRAAETAGPVVGDLMTSRLTESLVLPIYAPVVRSGQTVYVVGMSLEPERLTDLLRAQDFRGNGYAMVIDERGTILARSAEHDRFVGGRVPDEMFGLLRDRETGPVRRAVNLSGTDAIAAFRPLSKTPGWTVVVVEPLATYWASLRAPLAALGLGGLGAAAVALLAAAAVGRRILRPVRGLTRQAEAIVASGGELPEGRLEPACVSEFETLRGAARLAEAALRQRTAAVAAGEARLRAVLDTATDAIVVTDKAGVVRSFNRAAEAIFGYAAEEVVGHDMSMLMGARHAGRRYGLLAAYLHARKHNAAGIGREVEGRRKDGSPVPLELGVAEWRDEEGRRFFTGIMRDISRRKAEEARRKADEARQVLLVREVDHRAKNVLAVVQSVLRLTPAEDPRAFVAAVQARVAALSRAHTLLSEAGWSGADLRTIAERELAAYLPSSCGTAERQEGAVSLEGPSVPLAPTAVQPLAMVLHELATNAAKHGALCAAGGRVEVRWSVGRRAGEDGMFRLSWAEAGGPPVPGAPTRRGFGARVVESTVRGQLGGAVERRWEPTGLVVEIAIPVARVISEVDARAGDPAVALAA